MYSKLAVTSAILLFGAVWFCFASPVSATGSGFQRNLHQTPPNAKLTRRKFSVEFAPSTSKSGFQQNLHQPPPNTKLTRRKIFSGICTKHKQIRFSGEFAPTTTKHQTHPSQKNWILGHCFSVVQCSFAVMWLDTPPFYGKISESNNIMRFCIFVTFNSDNICFGIMWDWWKVFLEYTGSETGALVSSPASSLYSS